MFITFGIGHKEPPSSPRTDAHGLPSAVQVGERIIRDGRLIVYLEVEEPDSLSFSVTGIPWES